MIDPGQIWDFIEQSYADADGKLGVSPRRIALPKDYTLSFTGSGVTTGIPTLGTQSQVLQIQANGDFVLCRIRFMAYAGATPTSLTNNTAIVPLIRIQITDSGTDEQYANAPVDINCFATNAGQANGEVSRVYPRLISGASSLNITLTSYDSTTAYSLDLVLQGVLVKTFGV